MKKKTRFLLFAGLLLVMAASLAIASNYRFLKNKLLLHFLSPAAYLAAVETEYLTGQSQSFAAASDLRSSSLAAAAPTGAALRLAINQLAALALGEEFLLQEAALSFAWQQQETDFSLLATLSLNNTDCASLTVAQQDSSLFFFCPELSDATMSAALSEEDSSIFPEIADSMQDFLTSIFESVRTDPYQHLLPFVEAFTDVSLWEEYPLALADTTLSVTKIEAVLSADTAFLIASRELERMEHSESLTLYYQAASHLFDYLSKKDTDLILLCYVDASGQVLGHEVQLFQENELIFEKTGLLFTDAVGGKSGDILLHLPHGTNTEESLTLTFSFDQVGISRTNGYPEGRISVSSSELPSASAILYFDGAQALPGAALSLRALGFTLASLSLEFDTMPSTEDMQAFVPTDPLLTDLNAYLDTISPDTFFHAVLERTGISLRDLLSLLDN